MRTLSQRLQDKIQFVFQRDPAARSIPEVILCYPGLHALFFHRVANKLWRSECYLLARMISHFSRFVTGIEIHPGAQIGKNFFIDHGMGVVIGETSIIGDNVTLYHGVTLGGTTWEKVKRHPTLEEGVVVAAGAKVLGNITIGRNSRIGAGSVVVKSVPENCTVVGIPGRVVAQDGIRVQEGDERINLNHHLIPDLVDSTLKDIARRVEALEREVSQKFEKLQADTPPANGTSVPPDGLSKG